MRYPDSSAADGYHGSLFERLFVDLDHRSNCFDSLGHPNIGQEYQSRMRNPAQIDQLSEVLVHGDENPALRSRSFQQSSVARVSAKGPSLHDVVSVVAQPLRQPAPSASVGKESHCLATETGARVSPAITVWAYAMQARMSSASSPE